MTMFKKKRETDTLTQQRTRQYVKMMLGAYLIYTAYSMGRDLHQGIQADNPALIIAIAAVFALFGLFLCVAGFAKAMKLSAEELKEKENLSVRGKRRKMRAAGIDIGTTTISGVVLDTEAKKVLKAKTIQNGSFIKAEHEWEQIQDVSVIRTKACALLDERWRNFLM